LHSSLHGHAVVLELDVEELEGSLGLGFHHLDVVSGSELDLLGVLLPVFLFENLTTLVHELLFAWHEELVGVHIDHVTKTAQRVQS